MKRNLLAAALVLLPLTAEAAPPIENASFHDADGARVLRESVLVEATPAAVWDAFTTDAGFTAWAVPVAHIEPHNGGTMEFALNRNGHIGDPGNVRHRIDLYQPRQMLIFHNEFVPPGGPIDAVLFPTLRTILTFEDAGGGKTRVTETVVGFGSGAAYDGLYAHLRDGNVEYLASLADHFHKTN
jgi:uncharacterized protein YndB with AHSA1/START domain